LAANELLDSGALHGNYIDATLMPDTSEILLPPSTRVMADGVSVDGLTIAGAAQTLDGIRWKNVTFVGTRLRYEGGEVSLQNVRFKNCTFGFSTDERGARLADAIALGQQTFVMQ
jgi:acyl dehydratase